MAYWDKLGPGMVDLGLNYFGDLLKKKQTDKMLSTAQGPLYSKLQGAAGAGLDTLGSLDPNAIAKQQFDQQQALMAPGNQAAYLDLMRDLQSKGMLGMASYKPVAGTASQGGSMNPMLAALFAAQEGARSKAAYEALGEGQKAVTSTVGNITNLSGAGNAAQTSGVGAVNAGLITPKPSILDTIIKGGTNAMSKPGGPTAVWEGIKAVPGLFSQGTNWLQQFLTPSTPAVDYSDQYGSYSSPGYDYSYDDYDYGE